MKTVLALSRAMHKQIDLAVDALMESENKRRTDELNHDDANKEFSYFEVLFSYEAGNLKSIEFKNFNIL